jgi:hypothetical protein
MRKILLCLLCAVTLLACGNDRTEEGLRKAATAYVAALEAGDVDTLRKYELSDTNTAVRMQKMRALYSDIRIESVNATEDEGEVALRATATMMGIKLEDVPLRQIWKYDGGWKLIYRPARFGFDAGSSQ